MPWWPRRPMAPGLDQEWCGQQEQGGHSCPGLSRITRPQIILFPPQIHFPSFPSIPPAVLRAGAIPGEVSMDFSVNPSHGQFSEHFLTQIHPMARVFHGFLQCVIPMEGNSLGVFQGVSMSGISSSKGFFLCGIVAMNLLLFPKIQLQDELPFGCTT